MWILTQMLDFIHVFLIRVDCVFENSRNQVQMQDERLSLV